MKVLHFYKTYFPDSIGGTEQVINQIARGTAQLGVTAEVLSLSATGDVGTIEIDAHKVHRSRTSFEIASTPFSATAFSRFRELVNEADLVHYHFPYPFADMLHFVSRVNKPSLVSYHSDIIKQKYLLKLYGPLMHRFLSSVDHIVAASPNYMQSSAVLSRFKDKTSVIPYGLDRGSYPAACSERLNFWRNKLGPRFFLFVGVIRYYKGLHTLVEAARNSDYPVVIVGSGPVERELKECAARPGSHNIYFAGHLPDEDKRALLEACYAFVFPSNLRSEAFGISLLEAAMYGKPMISCEIGTGTTFINIDKETGLVVPPDDPVAFREAMDQLWNSPVDAELMGERAAARYRELFTSAQMAAAYVALYKRLLGQ